MSVPPAPEAIGAFAVMSALTCQVVIIVLGSVPKVPPMTTFHSVFAALEKGINMSTIVAPLGIVTGASDLIMARPESPHMGDAVGLGTVTVGATMTGDIEDVRVEELLFEGLDVDGMRLELNIDVENVLCPDVGDVVETAPMSSEYRSICPVRSSSSIRSPIAVTIGSSEDEEDEEEEAFVLVVGLFEELASPPSPSPGGGKIGGKIGIGGSKPKMIHAQPPGHIIKGIGIPCPSVVVDVIVDESVAN